MNADREVVIEETLQQTLTQMKTHVWNEIEGLANQSEEQLPKTVFEKAEQDFEHTRLLNSMLASSRRLEPSQIDPKQCENSLAFRHLSNFFSVQANRFLRQIPSYHYNFETFIPEIKSLTSNQITFTDAFLPYITINAGSFSVKIVFSIDCQPSFIIVHGENEMDRSPFEQSDSRVFRTLAVYFSRALPDFLQKYKKQGLVEFIIWLKCYHNLFGAPCTKCGRVICRDLTGDLLPPIVRTVGTCYPYHLDCAPFEIELPDFGYVTLMSEHQMHEKISGK